MEHDDSQNLVKYLFKDIVLPIGLFIGFWVALIVSILFFASASTPAADGWNSIISKNQSYEDGEQKYYLSIEGEDGGSSKLSVDENTYNQKDIRDWLCVKDEVLVEDSICELKDEYDKNWDDNS